MTRTALITGVAGQDGSYLAELLLGKGYEVIGTVPVGGARSLDNLSRTGGKVMLLELDLGDGKAIAGVLARHQPAEVYNLAAMSFSPDCWDAPRKAGDLLGMNVVILLDALRSVCPMARLFQAGSSEMFGPDAPAPQSESTPFRPLSPYGAAKAYAHHMVRIYRERFSLYAVNGILFSHESPRRDERFLTRKVTRQLARIVQAKAGVLKLGWLDARRDWTFAGDIVRGMWLSLQAEKPSDYLFASGTTHSIRDFCKQAFAQVGLDYQDHVQVDPQFIRKETGLVVGDASRAQADLGWHPAIGFEELVSMMVQADLTAQPPPLPPESK